MKTATFTCRISPQLLTWMTKHAEETNQSRRAIIESALTQYRIEEMQKQMQTNFKRASTEAEILNLSEWGMDDYHEVVTSWKN
ncbi:MAG: putative transcriptional regulator [Candidatus Azotimanducaceae bacterium]|jgi:predicted transcriptional regulator